MGLQSDTLGADAVGHAVSWAMRDGVGSDAAAVEAVHWASRNAAYGHVRGWPPQAPDYLERVTRWRRWLSKEDITSIVLTESDIVVGFLTLRPAVEPDLDSSIAAEMPTIYVHPDRWRRGYGAALCAEGARRAARNGYRALVLWSLETNARAHAFYTALGFEPDDVTKLVEWPHEELTARRYRIAV
jgi:GNAT superfamily N-acetyltransferase